MLQNRLGSVFFFFFQVVFLDELQVVHELVKLVAVRALHKDSAPEEGMRIHLLDASPALQQEQHTEREDRVRSGSFDLCLKGTKCLGPSFRLQLGFRCFGGVARGPQAAAFRL